MFSINNKYLNPEGEICLKNALMGQRFNPAQPLLSLELTLRKVEFNKGLRESLLKALEPFTILEFEFLPLETENIRLSLELATSHQPDTILSIIGLVLEKNKNSP